MVTLRSVTMDDALDLLQWKNDWDTRRFSIVTEAIITWSNHLSWLERRLKKPGFYIIMDGPIKCGDLRFDCGEETEVSIRLDRKQRDKGIATEALRLGMELQKQSLIAKIVDGNKASYALFTKVGFVLTEDRKENGKRYKVLRWG